MQLFHMILVILAFSRIEAVLTELAPRETRREDRIKLVTERAGGPHGKAFDDLSFVNAASGHRRIAKVTIGPCVHKRRITYLAFEFKDFKRPKMPSTRVEHGKLGAKYVDQTVSLDIGEGDYIANVIIKTYLQDVGWSFHTRLGYMSVQSKNGGPPIECGYGDNSDPEYKWYAAKDQALLYFSGGSGDAVDFVKGHYIPVTDY